MIKKFFCILSIFLIILSASGCGSKNTTNTSNDASLTVEDEVTDKELKEIANGRTMEFNMFSSDKSFNKGEEYILKSNLQLVGTAIYSENGKYKKMIKKGDTYIVEDDTDLFYEFGSSGSVYLSGKINMDGKNQKYYVNLKFNIVDYDKLFNQINLNKAKRNMFNGIGASQVYEQTFKDYLNKNINTIIKDYMNTNNKSEFISVEHSLSFSDYAIDIINKDIEAKYGIKIEEIILSTK